MTQKCRTCNEIKSLTEYHQYFNRKKEVCRRRQCKACDYIRIKKWQDNNTDRVKEQKKKSYQNNKERANTTRRHRYATDHRYRENLAAKHYEYRTRPGYNIKERRRKKANRNAAFITYGGFTCAKCGLTDPEILNIDHIGGRSVHNHGRVMRGDSLYSWLKTHKYPPGFRVLCCNCNIKEYHNSRVKLYD